MPISNLMKVKYIKNFPKFAKEDMDVKTAVASYMKKNQFSSK